MGFFEALEKIGSAVGEATEKKTKELTDMCKKKCRAMSDSELRRYYEYQSDQGSIWADVAREEMDRRGLY